MYPQAELLECSYNYDSEKLWEFCGDKWDKLFIVDFSLRDEDMDGMRTFDNTPTWIDHHSSSIERFGESYGHWAGIREVGKAGCELTWEFLFPEEPMPRIVSMLGRYDVWDHADPNCIYANYGVLMLDDGFRREDKCSCAGDDVMWKDLFGSGLSPMDDNGNPISWTPVDQLCSMGGIAAIWKAREAEFKGHNAFEASIDGKPFLCVNTPMADSYDWESVMGDKYFGYCSFYMTKRGNYKYSLRQQGDNDVSGIAMKFGGGGHAGAAGFHADRGIKPGFALEASEDLHA